MQLHYIMMVYILQYRINEIHILTGGKTEDSRTINKFLETYNIGIMARLRPRFYTKQLCIRKIYYI